MVKRILAGILLVLLLIHAPGARLMAQGKDVDVTKLGPQVGETVPPFTLTDQTGREHTLQSLMGPNGLVLVFFRSADW